MVHSNHKVNKTGRADELSALLSNLVLAKLDVNQSEAKARAKRKELHVYCIELYMFLRPCRARCPISAS